jgi:hypothetical protein
VPYPHGTPRPEHRRTAAVRGGKRRSVTTRARRELGLPNMTSDPWNVNALKSIMCLLPEASNKKQTIMTLTRCTCIAQAPAALIT